jgi:heavy metal sensor kinase
MNTRSLKFQLIAWYAGLLTGCFALLGIVTYVVLQNSLIGALKETQLRRARQVAQLLNDQIQRGSEPQVGQEIQARYSPGINGRFVRITRPDGAILYLSPPPRDQSFDPSSLPPPTWSNTTAETSTVAPLLGGRKMLLTAHLLQMPDGARYLVETGAPMDEVHSDLRNWLRFLLVMLPIVAAIALGGGYVLVRRALTPVDRIAASAERISSHNLNERLPLAHTADELERLSVALNHMIERLDTAFKYSRRFVADASHELRTPLTVLRGELEGFLAEPSLNSDWRDRVGSLLEEVDRLANIVEGLFAISRLDAGEAAAEWIPVDLAQLVTSTADQMALLAEDKNIRVTCDAPMPVWVEGDRSRLKQVVVNLLDNAIKYTASGGAVTLRVNVRDSHALLEVADNGIGIPANALPRVFDRFFRVDKARSRDQGGAGLGLSIVKSICTAHHGRVDANSTLGRGSRFRVELPLAPAPAAGLGHAPAQANNHHPQTS